MSDREPYPPPAAVTGGDRSRRWSPGRITFLAVSALCLYVFAPSIAEAFEAWHGLGRVNPVALVAVLGCEFGSFACVWMLQGLALRTKDWFTVVNTQLAGNAFNRITPGGGVSGTALQARMLADAGFGLTTAISALTLQSLLVSAAVVALPLLSLPVIIFTGTSVPGDLADGAWIGGGVFVVMLLIGGVLLGSHRAARRLGNAIEWVVNTTFRRRRAHLTGTGERFLHERDAIRDTLGAAWLPAVGTAVGRWGFEYFALLITLYAIGADPNPALVLIAFAAGSALTMIPLTPGGLGFVEAGLAGALVLAGISTSDAVLATLVFRLVSFWLPLPIGAGAAVVFRRRHPRR